MQVSIAFVRLQVRGEFVVTGDVADFCPHAATRPPSDVPEFTGGDPESVEVVGHLLSLMEAV